MNIIEKILNTLFFITTSIVIVCIITFSFFSNQLHQWFPYTLSVTMTEDMEPALPIHSLILIKEIKQNEEIQLKPQQIISFRVNFEGDSTLVTRYLNQVEVSSDGTTYYRTNGKNIDHLDPYSTTREDLVGTYILHIPEVGKLFLLLKNGYGMIVYMVITLIFLCYHIISIGLKLKKNKRRRKKKKIKNHKTTTPQQKKELHLDSIEQPSSNSHSTSDEQLFDMLQMPSMKDKLLLETDTLFEDDANDDSNSPKGKEEFTATLLKLMQTLNDSPTSTDTTLRSNSTTKYDNNDRKVISSNIDIDSDKVISPSSEINSDKEIPSNSGIDSDRVISSNIDINSSNINNNDEKATFSIISDIIHREQDTWISSRKQEASSQPVSVIVISNQEVEQVAKKKEKILKH